MEYFRSLIPSHTPENIDIRDDLRRWQEESLQIIMLSFAGLTLIFATLLINFSKSSSDWTYFFGFAFAAVATTGLVLLRKVSYWIRSIAFLVVFYIFATIVFIHNGWGGIALILLLSFSYLATIFLYQRPSRVGIGLSIGTLLFWSVLRSANLVPSVIETNNAINFVIDVLLVLFIGVVGNFAISSLKKTVIAERNQLRTAQENNQSLEEEIETQRTFLERRVFQLRTASEIAQATSSIFEQQALLQKVADLIQERFGLYYVGIFLIDEAREYAVLRYGTGDAGRRMMAAKHKLAVGGYSMIGWATQTRKSRVALDIGEEAVHFDNPLLPDTRSELALPIASANTVFGAMTIQSTQVNAFDENDVLILQSVADSLSISLENAASFQKNQKALEEIRVLNKAYLKQAWWDPQESDQNLKVAYENPQAVEPPENPTTVEVPLFLRDEVIGKIKLEVEGTELAQETQEFLQSISTQTSVALENARLIEESQMAAVQEQQLNTLAAQFSRATSIEEILKTAVLELGKLPAIHEASIALVPIEEAKPLGTRTLSGKEAK
jgi:GAF domain-containing protein